MKLYSSNTSPYGRKVRIVLAELGLSYEQDHSGAQVKSVEELAALNPALKIPILEVDGLVLFDSDLIIDYLFKHHPPRADARIDPPLAPAPRRAEQMWEDGKLLATLDALLESAVNLRQLGISGVLPEHSAYLQRHQVRIQHCLDFLERRASPEGFMPGAFSMADVKLICALDFGEFRDVFTWRGRPNLERLMDGFATRPSVVDTYPPL